MTKPIRCLISSSVTGQDHSGTFLQGLWEHGIMIKSIVRLDNPLQVTEWLTLEYLVVDSRDLTFRGHH